MPTHLGSGVSTSPNPRWYTPAKFLLAVLVMQGVLFLSAPYRWFWFNERKGYTVLITLAATAVALLLLAVAVVIGRLFKSKAQFSLATLLFIVPVMAIPCGWLAREMDLARRQRLAVQAIESREGEAWEMDLAERQQLPVLTARQGQTPYIQAGPTPFVLKSLTPLLGIEFFKDIHHVRDTVTSDEDLQLLTNLSQLHCLELEGTKVTNAGLVHVAKFKQLRTLDLHGPHITDAGIDSLRGLTNLRRLRCFNTKVSDEKTESLQVESLPDCVVHRIRNL
jgi:hypothetical protein